MVPKIPKRLFTVPRLPKRNLTGEEVAQVTGWTEGDILTWMLHTLAAKWVADDIFCDRFTAAGTVLFIAWDIAHSRGYVDDMAKIERFFNDTKDNTELHTYYHDNEKVYRYLYDKIRTLLFGLHEEESNFIFPYIAEALFTPYEIASACEWDASIITKIWAISGETPPGVTTATGGEQEELPKDSVDRMRREGAGNIEILRHLCQARGLGSKACGKLLFPDINPEAAKSKVRRMRQEHEID